MRTFAAERLLLPFKVDELGEVAVADQLQRRLLRSAQNQLKHAYQLGVHLVGAGPQRHGGGKGILVPLWRWHPSTGRRRAHRQDQSECNEEVAVFMTGQ